MPEVPIPGTHRDVWVFHELLRTIAVHYQNPPLTMEDSLFGTSTFFFDYSNAATEAKRGMLYKTGAVDVNAAGYENQNKADHNKYEYVSGKTGNQSTKRTDFGPSHKWLYIYRAWYNYLLANPVKPEFCILGPFYAAYIRNSGIEIGGKWYSPHSSLPAHPEARAHYAPGNYLDLQDFLDIVNPLGHFPPGVDILKDNRIVFFDPAQRDDFQARFQENYESDAPTMIDACIRQGRRIYYHELIEPVGKYGIRINFAPIGMGMAYEVPLDWLTFLYTEGQLTDNAFHYSGNRYGVEEAHFDIRPKRAMSSFFARDSWLQCWINQGKIPMDPQELANVYRGKVIGMNPCPYTEMMYPVEIKKRSVKRGFADFFAPIMEFGFACAAVAIAVARGDPSLFIGIAATTLRNVISQALPSIAVYSDMAIVGLTAAALSEFKMNQNDKEAKNSAFNMLKGMCDSEYRKMTGIEQENFDADTNDLVNTVDNIVTDKQKKILAAITDQLENRSSALIGNLAVASMQFQVYPQFQIAAASQIVQSDIQFEKAKKTGSNIMLGTGLVAGALLLKKILK